VTYCGVFTLDVDAPSIEPVLLVECPRLLFPFARNILADATREGGFPPVLLQPIDFVALWQSRRAAGAGQRHGLSRPGRTRARGGTPRAARAAIRVANFSISC
jgi:preprotein translocase subunit SecB